MALVLVTHEWPRQGHHDRQGWHVGTTGRLPYERADYLTKGLTRENFERIRKLVQGWWCCDGSFYVTFARNERESRGYRVYCCSITCSVESSESKYDSFTFCSKSRKLEQSYLVKCRLYHVCNPCMFMIGSFPRIAHLNEPMLIQGCLYWVVQCK